MSGPVVVFGATGLVGRDFIELCAKDFELKGLGSSDCDLSNLNQVLRVIEAHEPSVVVNCAAMADVDQCERTPDRAYQVNAMGPKNLAIACRRGGARLIHLSTDYVFGGGNSTEPYTEFDPPAPVNTYGHTKLVGEDLVLAQCPDSVVLRTSWVFGPARETFVDHVAVNALRGKTVVGIQDLVSAPTHVRDLTELIRTMVTSPQAGLFHASSRGIGSRVEIAREICRLLGVEPGIEVITQKEWGRAAPRPAFSAMRNYHLELCGLDAFPDWRSALRGYLEDYRLSPSC